MIVMTKLFLSLSLGFNFAFLLYLFMQKIKKLDENFTGHKFKVISDNFRIVYADTFDEAKEIAKDVRNDYLALREENYKILEQGGSYGECWSILGKGYQIFVWSDKCKRWRLIEKYIVS